MVRKQKNPIDSTKKQGVIVKEQEIHYSGIIPPPNIVQGYENVCPGAADRILAMTENDLKHKYTMEQKDLESTVQCRRKKLESEFILFKRGQNFGFIIMMTALIGGIYLLSIGKTIGGFVSLVGSIFFYFSSVMYKPKKQNKNIEEEEV
ncbi:MAG TPA: DUF2335 domain-containing protein [Fusobacterium sp.]|uniref:DUF2335 domain-containing protein n=1 Tax=Fusobacterium sp. TaxID=68766 RepID=UPI002F422030